MRYLLSSLACMAVLISLSGCGESPEGKGAAEVDEQTSLALRHLRRAMVALEENPVWDENPSSPIGSPEALKALQDAAKVAEQALTTANATDVGKIPANRALATIRRALGNYQLHVARAQMGRHAALLVAAGDQLKAINRHAALATIHERLAGLSSAEITKLRDDARTELGTLATSQSALDADRKTKLAAIETKTATNASLAVKAATHRDNAIEQGAVELEKALDVGRIIDGHMSEIANLKDQLQDIDYKLELGTKRIEHVTLRRQALDSWVADAGKTKDDGKTRGEMSRRDALRAGLAATQGVTLVDDEDLRALAGRIDSILAKELDAARTGPTDPDEGTNRINAIRVGLKDGNVLLLGGNVVEGVPAGAAVLIFKATSQVLTDVAIEELKKNERTIRTKWAKDDVEKKLKPLGPEAFAKLEERTFFLRCKTLADGSPMVTVADINSLSLPVGTAVVAAKAIAGDLANGADIGLPTDMPKMTLPDQMAKVVENPLIASGTDAAVVIVGDAFADELTLTCAAVTEATNSAVAMFARAEEANSAAIKGIKERQSKARSLKSEQPGSATESILVSQSANSDLIAPTALAGELALAAGDAKRQLAEMVAQLTTFVDQWSAASSGTGVAVPAALADVVQAAGDVAAIRTEAKGRYEVAVAAFVEAGQYLGAKPVDTQGTKWLYQSPRVRALLGLHAVTQSDEHLAAANEVIGETLRNVAAGNPHRAAIQHLRQIVADTRRTR